MENYLGIYAIFGSWNHPQMEAHTGHNIPGHARGPWRVVVGGSLLEGRLELYFGRKEAYIRKKIVLKSQRNRSYGSPGI